MPELLQPPWKDSTLGVSLQSTVFFPRVCIRAYSWYGEGSADAGTALGQRMKCMTYSMQVFQTFLRHYSFVVDALGRTSSLWLAQRYNKVRSLMSGGSSFSSKSPPGSQQDFHNCGTDTRRTTSKHLPKVLQVWSQQ